MKKIIFYSMLAAIIGVMSCNNGNKGNPPGKEPLVSDSLISSLQTATVEYGTEQDVIKLNGKIIPDENRLIKINAIASGRVTTVKAELGDYVKKGQLLAMYKSPEIAGFSNNILQAENDLSIARKNFQKTKDLYEGQLATEQEYETAKAEYNKALAGQQSAIQMATIAGGRGESLSITSPISGYIVEKNVTDYAVIREDNADDLFAVADLSTVWAVANVYESDLNKVQVGDKVTLQTLADPQKKYEGMVDKIYNVLDPDTRTMKIRISLPNPGFELKPEMFVRVYVLQKNMEKQLTIPYDAIVMDNSRNYVIIKKDNKILVKEINIIKRINDRAFVTGVLPGDQIVTQYPIFLYQALTDN